MELDHEMLSKVIRFLKNDDGATAIQYGLIAALIAVAAVATMTTVGTNLSGIFGTVASSLSPLKSNDGRHQTAAIRTRGW